MAAFAAAGALLAGCGGGGGDDGAKPAPDGAPGPRPGTIGATLATPADCLTVLAADSPAVVALAASRALFQSSPAAVVAPATDGPELRTATELARTRGIPLLLHADAAAAVSTTATPTAAPTAAASGTDSAPCPEPTPLPVVATPTATPLATATPTATGIPAATATATVGPETTSSPSAISIPSTETTATATPSGAPSRPAALSSYRDPAAEDDGVQCLPISSRTPVATASPSPTATATPAATPTPTATASPTAPATSTPTSSPASSATPGTTETAVPAVGAPSGLDPALSTELGRLAPQAVLATTPAIADLLRAALPGLKVVGSADELPATSPAAAPSPELTVLVPAEADLRAGALAAAATARAAGARAIGVANGDPRSGGCVVEELSLVKPAKVVAIGGFGPAERLGDRLAVVATGEQIPGGGQLFFPGRRLVALYGYPGAPELGVLGAQGPQAAVARAKSVAALYNGKGGVPVVPTFEIIVTVAQGVAGSDGDYSAETSIDKIRPWIEAAEAAGVYVILDLQPGRTDFLTQAKRYEELLRLPHVGLALDPEWRLKPGQVHLRQIGSVDASEINRVANWLADLTARYRLPQKVLVIHQFTLNMITNRASLDTSRDEIAVLVHFDGQGEPSGKEGSWRIVTRTMPSEIWMGWKNFYRKDTRVMSPDETLNRTPVPVMISYQ
ncbi:MAG: hypothetical protein ACT4QF_23490 [Sporichthyaceae bacterium]